MRSVYISTLGFLLAKPVRKGFKAGLVYGTCVARAVPCTIYASFSGDLMLFTVRIDSFRHTAFELQ